MSNGAERAAGSGSPITVDGGGSVSLSFGHKFYECACGNKANGHKHVKGKAAIDSVVIDIPGFSEPIVIPIDGKRATVSVFLRNHEVTAKG